MYRVHLLNKDKRHAGRVKSNIAGTSKTNGRIRENQNPATDMEWTEFQGIEPSEGESIPFNEVRAVLQPKYADK